jgi:hypothetical protein
MYLVFAALASGREGGKPNGLDDAVAVDIVPDDRSLQGHASHRTPRIQMDNLLAKYT